MDFYAGGPEHVQRHHLYARFVTMALHDLGLARLRGAVPPSAPRGADHQGGGQDVQEPRQRGRPRPLCRGARLGRAALCAPVHLPVGSGGDFHDDTIAGIERFFGRVWKLATPADGEAAGPEPHVERAIVLVTDAIERLSFNVALARLMELSGMAHSSRAKKVLVQLLAPFAPHLAEELWRKLGQSFSVHTSPWPVPDKAVLEAEDVEIVVQVNGRVRGQVRVGRGAEDAEVVAAAANAVGVERPARVVYVPDRLVNLVI